MSRRSLIHIVLVFLFIFSVGLNNYFWLTEDNSISGVDSAGHLISSIDFFDKASDIIRTPAVPIWMKIVDMVKLIHTSLHGGFIYWPNGLNLNAAVFYSVFGRSIFSAKLTLLPYFFILIFSTIGIGKLIFSESVGILSGFIVSMYPLIFAGSRQFQLDFPLTSILSISILFLLKSDYFRDRRYCLFMGFSSGMAMLIKGQFLLFFTGPFLFVIYTVLKGKEKAVVRFRQLGNILIVIIVASLIASIWWGYRIPEIKLAFNEHIFNPQKANLESIFGWRNKYSFPAITFYFKALFKSLGPIYFLIFIIPFIFFLRKRVKYREIILSWLIIPFLLFSLVFSFKHTRFLMPLMPPVAIVSAWGLSQIRSKIIKIPVLSAIVIYALIHFYVFSYCPWSYRNISLSKINVFGRLEFDSAYETAFPHKEELNIEEVVKVIRKNIPFSRPVKIGSISCGGLPTNLDTIYWIKLQDRLLEPIDLTEMVNEFIENFDSLDIIVFQQPVANQLLWPGGKQFGDLLKEKHGGRVWQLEQAIKYRWENLLKSLEEAQTNFKLVSKVFKNDNNVYYIYKRIGK